MLAQETEIAIKTAISAGGLLRERFRTAQTSCVKEDGSLVSDADLVSHEFILKEISSAFPSHTILSEESPGALQAQIKSGPTWVVDPLDGTSNFLAGLPLFTVTLALVDQGETKLGVIYDPTHNDLYVGVKGGGTTLNGKKACVSRKDTPRGAMLFAGRAYKERDHVRHANIISTLERQTTYFRRLGCATIMLASVACGRADAVILTGKSPWDTVAGALLVQEAGGKISDYCGNDWSLESEDLAATNGILHKKLTDITSVLENSSWLL